MKIELVRLGRRVGKRWLMRELSFLFQEGAINVLLGPNGAGKTTLLRLAATLDKPSEGEVLADGRSLWRVTRSELREIRRRWAFVFQSPLFLLGTAEENLLFPLRLRGEPLSRERIDRLCAGLDLTRKLSQPVFTLSGGEKQKLQLVRALLLQPEVLFLDEPASSLDPLSLRQVETLLREWAEEGNTVILSTHNIAQARFLADRLLFLQEGRRVDDLPEWGWERPFNWPENLLQGTLESQEGEWFLRVGEFLLRVPDPGFRGAASALVAPEGIVVSSQPLSSSAKNSLPCRILSHRDLGELTALEGETGGLRLWALLTKSSWASLKDLQGPLFFTFKAASIKLFPKESP